MENGISDSHVMYQEMYISQADSSKYIMIWVITWLYFKGDTTLIVKEIGKSEQGKIITIYLCKISIMLGKSNYILLV